MRAQRQTFHAIDWQHPMRGQSSRGCCPPFPPTETTMEFEAVTEEMTSKFLKDFDVVTKVVFVMDAGKDHELVFRVIGNSRTLLQNRWEIQFEGCDIGYAVDENEMLNLLHGSKFAWVKW